MAPGSPPVQPSPSKDVGHLGSLNGPSDRPTRTVDTHLAQCLIQPRSVCLTGRSTRQ
ncbi:hypothetical protein PMIN01_05488 [Paraphaeosphaeria minitans]|uniref:Uncharacterized protein n=1 Tax=Paraphaeosphaeria minitans TaxID=565426 RepID=A0A9P6KTF6_9PLEO|nr:hypothetical protein PMIN01_05488 [Paraphaeosphaeria minitans]